LKALEIWTRCHPNLRAVPFDFARYSYRTDTIALPTREDAPTSFDVWLPQRTRWMKGYIQTWLVHMRDPGLLRRELGLRSFLTVQIMCLGLVLSSLVHPLLLATGLYFGALLAGGATLGTFKTVLLVVDCLNVLGGYASFLLLAWRASTREERRSFGKLALFMPVYWMMLSLAAWRAVYQLARAPHRWEKTPHRARRVGEAEG
jgi:cellulose synthase/poly-beta-1,6-N-acetylglucosamine synthase-like glycosyltransferase